MIYLMDANTYIQAKNTYYQMDICPAYWDWLDVQCISGVVASIDMIGRELKDGNDELAIWAKERNMHFLSNDDEVTQKACARVVEYVMGHDFSAGSRDHFLEKADPWLIAKAMTIDATVVTHESRLVPATKKVKVPNICNQFGVRCINTFDFLRETKAKFELA